MADMTGKSVLITGASRGIGAAAARAFAEAGAHVALAARSEEAIASIAREIGGNALPLPCDVADFGAVSDAVRAVVKSFGRIDVLVNNAAVIEPIARMETVDPAEWATALDINLKGVFHGFRAAMPVMAAMGGGTILTISSGAAVSAMEGWSAYCTAKAGAAMLTRCADLEGREKGIRVIGLSPGTVATDMQKTVKESGVNPVSRLDWSDHIPPAWPAQALLWMCTPDADEFLGRDVALKERAIRRRVGLPT
ncbi:Dehydrogenases with different specificities (related to short-chain alcohol dehydrogenases) [Rhodovulum sp. P5]|uniref:SDR family oxidoreductase n=1 Tax=Rhodovulum sp. P5 TaxID=1564506 RepID=UPI0009C2231B|nr:SDR family oxidoreductase [Rhodovulum sp. P5]ARE41428.1 Dehydrogenases with different specificities (related to short-chain alcohol dehydrogenases) [Rhodovulum sp. P5]